MTKTVASALKSLETGVGPAKIFSSFSAIVSKAASSSWSELSEADDTKDTDAAIFVAFSGC